MEANEAVSNTMLDAEQTMDGTPLEEEGSLKMVSRNATPPISLDNSSGCFDCNICLDFAVDPVVTLCGHLYCWPCIYQWLQVEDGNAPQSCPVCKASLSEHSIVPLYGRGKPAKQHHEAQAIPRRPSVPGDNTSGIEPHFPRSPWHQNQPLQYVRHNHHLYPPNDGRLRGELAASTSSAILGSPRLMTTTAGGVLGEMAVAGFPWVFRNHLVAVAGGLFYSNPYPQTGLSGASPRLRRLEMRVERSLNQIWLFLLCCALLCLLFF